MQRKQTKVNILVKIKMLPSFELLGIMSMKFLYALFLARHLGHNSQLYFILQQKGQGASFKICVVFIPCHWLQAMTKVLYVVISQLSVFLCLLFQCTDFPSTQHFPVFMPYRYSKEYKLDGNSLKSFCVTSARLPQLLSMELSATSPYSHRTACPPPGKHLNCNFNCFWMEMKLSR